MEMKHKCKMSSGRSQVIFCHRYSRFGATSYSMVKIWLSVLLDKIHCVYVCVCVQTKKS